MVVVAIAWMYVVVLMALAEGFSSQGSWLGAAFTFVLYGLLPMSIALYLLGTPGRRRALRAAEASRHAAAAPPSSPHPAQASARLDPDGGGHAAGDAVAPIGEKP